MREYSNIFIEVGGQIVDLEYYNKYIKGIN
jgi:hypothetical protein